jgi:hypothetical protein
MMVICSLSSSCTTTIPCSHRELHERNSVCDWKGCHVSHPRTCVEESSAKLIAFIAEVKAMGKLEELKALLKEPRKRKPTTIPADQVSTPLPDAISPAGVKHKTSRKKEA